MRCGAVAPGDICGIGSFQLNLVLEEGRDCQCVLRQEQSRAPAQGICSKDGLVSSEVSLGLNGEQYETGEISQAANMFARKLRRLTTWGKRSKVCSETETRS